MKVLVVSGSPGLASATRSLGAPAAGVSTIHDDNVRIPALAAFFFECFISFLPKKP
jgi:hypothetical protein